MNYGYIRIPRSLLNDPLWIGLNSKQRQLFQVILENVCFRPQKFDDFGVIIDLEIGQLCASIREIKELCPKDFSKNDVERYLLKLQNTRFLRQEVRHRKTVITITHKDTYDLIGKKSETLIETNLRQTRDKLETQTNKDKKAKKEKNKCSIPPQASELAQFLFSAIEKTKPDVKPPNLKNWAIEINRMITLDNRSFDKLKEIIEYLPNDEFWCDQILSAKKLREKFDQLELSKRKKIKFKAKDDPSFEVDPALAAALKRRAESERRDI